QVQHVGVEQHFPRHVFDRYAAGCRPRPVVDDIRATRWRGKLDVVGAEPRAWQHHDAIGRDAGSSEVPKDPVCEPPSRQAAAPRDAASESVQRSRNVRLGAGNVYVETGGRLEPAADSDAEAQQHLSETRDLEAARERHATSGSASSAGTRGPSIAAVITVPVRLPTRPPTRLQPR